MARLLVDKYGYAYIEHPRMESLIDFNEIKVKDYLKRAQEAEAFSNKEFVKLHQSTLRKVEVFSNILNRAIQGTLKVKTKWYEIYGISPQGFWEYCQRQWWIQLIWTVVLLILGAWLGSFF